MILISHRGNIDGNYCERYENSHDYIQNAIDAGYDVEIDVRQWYESGYFLGHDEPLYPVTLDWLLERKDKLWVHAKNFAALQGLIDSGLRVFFHEKEKHTIINNSNLIWSHALEEANHKSIIPLLSNTDIDKWLNRNVYGICSDFIKRLREEA